MSDNTPNIREDMLVDFINKCKDEGLDTDDIIANVSLLLGMTLPVSSSAHIINKDECYSIAFMNEGKIIEVNTAISSDKPSDNYVCH